MTGKHTEGEWESRGAMIVTPPGAEVDRRIATGEFPFDCKKVGEATVSHYIDGPEAEANARLMAAAPRMLVALQTTEYLLNLIATYPGLAGTSSELSTALTSRIVRLAIKKATGPDHETHRQAPTQAPREYGRPGPHHGADPSKSVFPGSPGAVRTGPDPDGHDQGIPDRHPGPGVEPAGPGIVHDQGPPGP